MSKLLPFLFLLCLFQTACFEPKEGCLDIEASNYTVDADDACSECCVYPKLKIQTLHRVDFTDPDTSFNFFYGRLYPNPGEMGDSFTIERARFLLSDIKLIRESGEEVGVLDTINLEIPAGSPVTIEDSFAKLDRDFFAAQNVGDIRTEGVFTAVKFTLGLSDFLRQTEPTTVPSGHPLSIATDVLNYDTLAGAYIPNILIFRQDTAAIEDSLFVQILEPDTVTLPFPTPFELSKGFDATLKLRVDYMKWFEGINVKDHPMTDISTAIRQNLPNAISVEEISQ